MVAVGHLLVYGIGALDLTHVFGTFLGDTQFKQVTVIAALALILAVGATCWAVQERVLVTNSKASEHAIGAWATLKEIYRTTTNLPNRIKAICWIQFWSWIGFFPFLFYTSEWLGEIYLRSLPEAEQSRDALGDIGRVGSMSLIVMSLVSSAGSFIMPLFVRSPHDDDSPGFTPRPPAKIAAVVNKIGRPSLLMTWTIGHMIFACSMIFAPFVSSLGLATFIVALCGM